MNKPLCLMLLAAMCSFFAGCQYITPGQTHQATIHHESLDPALHSQHNYWGDTDAFLQAQARHSLYLADQLLQQYPPSASPSTERQAALLLIDAAVHDPASPDWPVVQAFLEARIIPAITDIEQTQVTQGAVIWKLYNETFIVRTPSVTIAFDLVRGHLRRHPQFGLEDAWVQRVVDECDVLFISHRHHDHADPVVAEMFLAQGKPVIAPPEVWQDEAIHQHITHLPRIAHELQSLELPLQGITLQVVNYPGHQGANIQNNVPVVISPEGLSFAHTGDQSLDSDFDWIDHVHTHHAIDVVMPNNWTTDIHRLVRGFSPKLVLPGHENELGHSIDHREPLWSSFDRLRGSETPFMVLAWGERVDYQQ